MNTQSAALLLMISGPALADVHCRTGSEPIPDNGQTPAIWTLDVTADGIVTNAALSVMVAHEWVGDLRFELIAPDGMVVKLLDRPGLPDSSWIGPWGCGGDDIQARFTDAAGTPAETMCSLAGIPVISGDVLPAEPLTALVGHPAQGTWTFRIYDDSPVDAGRLENICLDLQTAADCNGNGVPDPNDISSGTSADLDSNGIPDECECPSDATGDNRIDIQDILLILADFGQSGSPGDIDGNGIVDITDLLSVLRDWDTC